MRGDSVCSLLQTWWSLSRCLYYVGFIATSVSATESDVLVQYEMHMGDGELEVRQYNYTAQPQTCGIPNIVPGQRGNRPELTEGVWYSYRQTPPIPINSYFATIGIRQTHLPATGVAAETQWFQLPQYASDNKTCTYQFWSGYATASGQQLGELSLDTDGYIPRPDNYISMYYDYNTFGFDYQCALPNYTTGLCDQPIFFIQTRTEPYDLSAEAMQKIDDIVASVLKPYCLSLDNVPKTVFIKDLPLCPLIDTPDCFSKRIQGYADSKL